MSCAPFFITDSERGMFGLDIPQKKIMGLTGWKNRYGHLKKKFKKKIASFFSNVQNFDSLKPSQKTKFHQKYCL